MAEYKTPVDIGNRAAQHCGVKRFKTFNDDSKAAVEIGACYDQLRTAELRRNVWRFACRRACLRPIDTTTMELVPTAWTPTNAYVVGSVVAWQNEIYLSISSNNVNNQPDTNPDDWTLYFGPMTITPWEPQTFSGPSTLQNQGGYYAGELVYVLNGTIVTVYMSLLNGNTATPVSFPNWDPTITYSVGQTVSFSLAISGSGQSLVVDGSGSLLAAQVYQSTMDLNLNNTPGASPFWQLVPSVSTQPDYEIGQFWLALDSGVQSIAILYPIGTGPLSQATTWNVFQLPNGFLREAPQNPKQGSHSILGAPSNDLYNDWVLQGNYLLSSFANPILYRFVADIADVTMMDPMFCEGLAARIGSEVCETLTQSTAKLDNIERQYKVFMDDARTVNGIETGATEPARDDYLECRY